MSTPSTNADPIGHIIICGHGLAARMTAATLARQLAPAIRITLVLIERDAASDLFYGTVTAPSAYAFNLAAGVDEPSLVLRSDTAFSWGTRYLAWGAAGRAWTQCFNLAFPNIDGVQFHQYLAATAEDAIEPYLAGAAAGARGGFAHPPQGPGKAAQHPLARAEYGYQFDPANYAALFAAAVPPGRIEIIAGAEVAVESGEHGIDGLRVDGGAPSRADLYVDCSGPDAVLLSRLAPMAGDARRVSVVAFREQAERAGSPLRTVTPTQHGWTAETPLRDELLRITVHNPADPAAMPDGTVSRAAQALIGRRTDAWAGNCVGIGHAAGVVEPLSPAPMMLLERDIERLVSLIPNAGPMVVERREYNRRFTDDFLHASLFNRAIVEPDGLPDTAYWRAARAEPLPEKLARKLALFESRGVLVAYDLEPFHPEDWTILHLGMGRRPARHDPLADRASPAQVRQFLSTMKQNIAQMAATLPASATYRTELEAYLREGGR
ncbi:tryptophan 7-halogenase [Sphingomonas sp. RS6]